MGLSQAPDTTPRVQELILAQNLPQILALPIFRHRFPMDWLRSRMCRVEDPLTRTANTAPLAHRSTLRNELLVFIFSLYSRTAFSYLKTQLPSNGEFANATYPWGGPHNATVQQTVHPQVHVQKRVRRNWDTQLNLPLPT